MITTCQNCGERFSPKHAVDYYCSDECHFDYLESKREYLKEESITDGKTQ